MYLKAINLKGFKSFPDRTRLTFSPGVSVIVGPNGSGKSNITDAVLWALGEQSPSAVRGQQMRDVIFAGGNGQSPRRFAEVEVVIDNSEGRAASEFSEISISRRIERNGDGEYRLNGARCRLVDIVEALSDTNMGREAHSVISQGKVEADRQLEAQGPPPADRGGGGARQAPQAPPQRPAQAGPHPRQPRAGDGRRARGALAPAAAEAPGRGGRADRQARARSRTSCVPGSSPTTCARSRSSSTAAEAKLAEVRATRDSVEKRFEEVRARRTAIEERIAAGEEGRRRHGELLAEARAATERVRARAESLEVAERDLRAALGERQLRLEALDDGAGRGRRPRPGSPSSRPSWRSSGRTHRRRAPGCAGGRGGRAAPSRRQGCTRAASGAPRMRSERRFARRPRCTSGPGPRREKAPSAQGGAGRRAGSRRGEARRGRGGGRARGPRRDDRNRARASSVPSRPSSASGCARRSSARSVRGVSGWPAPRALHAR